MRSTSSASRRIQFRRSAAPSGKVPTICRIAPAARSTSATAGFQVIAFADGETAGKFASDDTAIDVQGSQVRSSVARAVKDAATVWHVTWTSPSEREPVSFFFAAVSANDDASPFGDQSHYRRYRLIPANDD